MEECRLRSNALRCLADSQARLRAALQITVSRHQNHRQRVTAAHGVLIQGAAFVEDHAAARRNLHMCQLIARFFVHAAGSECVFLQPLLNLFYPLVWLEMQWAMNI